MIGFRTAIALTALLALAAQAEIYKHVDEKGRVTYSNKPIKGGQKVELPELSTFPASKVDTNKAKSESSARDKQRSDMEEQLAQEEKALKQAQEALKEAEQKPEVSKHTKTVAGPDGKPVQVTETRRNVPAYEAKIKKLKDEITLHEDKAAKLKAELAELSKAARPEKETSRKTEEKK